MTKAWTDEQTQMAKELYLAGKDCKDIADLVGRSFRAVYKKMELIGAYRPSLPRGPRPMKQQPPSRNSKPPGLTDIPVEPEALGHTIDEVGSQGCRWPIGGEMADTRFCCRPRARGSYCASHAARAYTGGIQIPNVPKELQAILRRAA